jgi:hypothetical protein
MLQFADERSGDDETYVPEKVTDCVVDIDTQFKRH